MVETEEERLRRELIEKAEREGISGQEYRVAETKTERILIGETQAEAKTRELKEMIISSPPGSRFKQDGKVITKEEALSQISQAEKDLRSQRELERIYSQENIEETISGLDLMKPGPVTRPTSPIGELGRSFIQGYENLVTQGVYAPTRVGPTPEKARARTQELATKESVTKMLTPTTRIGPTPQVSRARAKQIAKEEFKVLEATKPATSQEYAYPLWKQVALTGIEVLGPALVEGAITGTIMKAATMTMPTALGVKAEGFTTNTGSLTRSKTGAVTPFGTRVTDKAFTISSKSDDLVRSLTISQKGPVSFTGTRLGKGFDDVVKAADLVTPGGRLFDVLLDVKVTPGMSAQLTAEQIKAGGDLVKIIKKGGLVSDTTKLGEGVFSTKFAGQMEGFNFMGQELTRTFKISLPKTGGSGLITITGAKEASVSAGAIYQAMSKTLPVLKQEVKTASRLGGTLGAISGGLSVTKTLGQADKVIKPSTTITGTPVKPRTSDLELTGITVTPGRPARTKTVTGELGRVKDQLTPATKITTSVDTRLITAPGITTGVMTGVMTGVDIGLDLQTMTRTGVGFPGAPTTPITGPTSEPPSIPLVPLLTLDSKVFGRRAAKPSIFKPVSGYGPSLTAIFFGKRGKKKRRGLFTGLELRPIIKRGRSRSSVLG